MLDEDTPPPAPLARFVCPNCGATAERGSEGRPTTGVVQGTFVCPSDHLFVVKWMEAS